MRRRSPGPPGSGIFERSRTTRGFESPAIYGLVLNFDAAQRSRATREAFARSLKARSAEVRRSVSGQVVVKPQPLRGMDG